MKKSGKREEWRDVVGCEGLYMVSNVGSVKSIDRKSKRGDGLIRNMRGVMLSPGIGSHKYKAVNLFSGPSGKQHCVHRLVAEAFIGKCPDGMECCHNDGDRTNNKATNLRWATRADNCKDMIKHGMSTRGEKNPNSKLTEIDIRFIRHWINTGCSNNDIARAFCISPGTVSKIDLGDRWGWLT